VARPSRWNEVVAAAAFVFNKRGFANATLEEIADELGIWKGSLYNYISTKEDLLTAVVQIPADRLIADIEELNASSLSPEAKVRAVVHRHIAVFEEYYDFAAVYLHEVAGRQIGEEWNERDRRYAQLVEDMIVDGVERGVFLSSSDPHVSTMILLGSINWLTRWWDPKGAISSDRLADEIADTIMGGLMTRRKPRRAPMEPAPPTGATPESTSAIGSPTPPATTKSPSKSKTNAQAKH
jgi:TetR/AcrR family transcriptional regulator, cholesterol catabolism regulator